LFYNELGNKAYLGIDGQIQAGYGFVNTGPFKSLISGTINGSYFINYGRFELATGAQLVGVDNMNGFGFALAVRPGDVAAVPLPAAGWLFGSGLLGLIGVVRAPRFVRLGCRLRHLYLMRGLDGRKQNITVGGAA